MIALLTGKIAGKSPDSVILDVNGVGYRVQIPFSTFFALPDDGATLTLNIHTNVKEDAIHLFGFLTPREKQFFQLLITVSAWGRRIFFPIFSPINLLPPSAGVILSDFRQFRESAKKPRNGLFWS